MFDVEFIGGPYDGHKELLGSACPVEELAWIVCEDVFRLLAGKERALTYSRMGPAPMLERATSPYFHSLLCARLCNPGGIWPPDTAVRHN
jgi:hypothetical protein